MTESTLGTAAASYYHWKCDDGDGGDDISAAPKRPSHRHHRHNASEQNSVFTH